MSSRCRDRCVVLLAALVTCASATAREIVVCADPDNLPYSNADGRGFENRIAEIVAARLGAVLSYYWLPDRRGFLRKTLDANLCDVVIGLPVESERALTTPAYYRSTYVFVYRKERLARLSSLDDPRLATLRIGVPLVGNDAAATPPAQALAARGLVANVVGFPMFAPKPIGARVVEAVRDGTIDVGVLWGPQAGYFARGAEPALVVTPIATKRGATSTFDIAMGVRRGDAALQRDLARAIAEARPAIDAVLDSYAVVRATR
jgi:mxaJ protein